MTTRTAADIYAAITENTDAFYADRIDIGTFRRQNRALWDSIHEAGMDREVEALIRSNERPAMILAAPWCIGGTAAGRV
jgi:hypothetical protein